MLTEGIFSGEKEAGKETSLGQGSVWSQLESVFPLIPRGALQKELQYRVVSVRGKELACGSWLQAASLGGGGG